MQRTKPAIKGGNRMLYALAIMAGLAVLGFLLRAGGCDAGVFPLLIGLISVMAIAIYIGVQLFVQFLFWLTDDH